MIATLRWAGADSLVITQRHLRHIPRIPELMFFAIFQPIMFILLFSVVFAKAIPINTPGLDYINFMMPGIFVQTMAFATAGVSVGFADDLHKGLIDRFRSLPMSRAAVVIGRIASELVRNLGVVLIMTLVGFVVGFRFQNGVPGAVGGVLLLLGFAFAFMSIGTLIGLWVRSVEAANMAGIVWLFPLTFLSNAFVPMRALPGWLQPVVEHSPVTVTVDALRGMYFGGPIAGPLLESVAWIVGIALVTLTMAIRRYKRAASR